MANAPGDQDKVQFEGSTFNSYTVSEKLTKLQDFVEQYASNSAWDPTATKKNENEQLSPQYSFRIKTDLKVFFTDPIPDIILAPDMDNLLIAHAIIVGPEDTPYEGGFFYFFIKFPYNYPINPPLVKLMTTAQNTVRFNPNLYDNGKVCLSILNTWPGPQWNPGSTLYSVLLSIQSIMNENPYHNEPGYQVGSPTEYSSDPVKQYNDIIRHETIRVAVIGMMEDNFDSRNMPAVLKDYVTEYFKTKINYYNRVIEANVHLDGEPMNDPFKDPRGAFQYKALKLKMDKLKERYLVDRKTNIDGDRSN